MMEYTIVHKCSDEVKELASEAVEAFDAFQEHMSEVKEHMEAAQQKFSIYIQRRDQTLAKAQREYPPLADEYHKCTFKARDGVIIEPRRNHPTGILLH